MPTKSLAVEIRRSHVTKTKYYWVSLANEDYDEMRSSFMDEDREAIKKNFIKFADTQGINNYHFIP